MLLVVGYYASSGGYGVWLARKTGVSATRAQRQFDLRNRLRLSKSCLQTAAICRA